MNQIKPYAIWIGHTGEGSAVQSLFAAGIRAIVHLAVEEPAIQPPREFIYLRFPLLDGEGNDARLLRLAVGSVAELVKQKFPTLVCCGAGMSRSPAVVAAALSKVQKTGLDESLKNVTDHHAADVSPGFWNDLHHAGP